VIMRLFCFASILLLSSLVYGQDHPQAKSTNQETAQKDQTEIKPSSPEPQVAAPHSAAKPSYEQSNPQRELIFGLTHGELVMSILTGVYVLLTGFYVRISHKTLNTIKDDVESGSREFASQLKVAQASADAMTVIADTIKIGNKAVTRAYLTVIVGTAVYQERGNPGQGDKRFQGIPKLLNTGLTTARKINIRINAKVLGLPIPKDFTFPNRDIPETAEATQFLSLGAHQHADLMGGIVDDFAPDNEVAAIKEGAHKALCVWGNVSYVDIFGDTHVTRFGQQIYWWPNGAIRAFFIPGQNDAD
jgi:hypothetical protein